MDASAQTTSSSRFSRPEVVMWLAVIGSALLVVWSTHQAREQHAELMTLQIRENQLQVEHGEYLLQEGALTSPGRLEQAAQERLKMRIPEMAEIRVIRK